MFYPLTDSQVRNIKSNIYPNITLDKVIITEAGSDSPDNVLNITISCLELKFDFSTRPPTPLQFKVFNNELAKKYMKFKVFEISSDQMKTEALDLKNIQNLNNLINKYGTLSIDLNAGYDFIGDRTNPALAQRANIDTDPAKDPLKLIYNFKFILPRPKIQNLYLGIIAYLDKEEYLKDKNIDSKFTDKKIFYDTLTIYPIVENYIVKDSTNLGGSKVINDLRLVKSIFTKNNNFENLLFVIDSDQELRKLQNTDKLLPTDSTLSINNFNDIDQNSLNIGRKISNAFYSRNFNNSLGLLFTVDYESIAANNSPYKNIIFRSNYKADLLKNCRATSISILRRQVEKKGIKYIPKLETTKKLIDGSINQNGFIEFFETKVGSIEEIQLNTNLNFSKNFAISDKTVFYGTGLYQYGIEININDSITSYISGALKVAENDINNLNTYLAETDKIVTTTTKAGQLTLNGSYDPQSNSFTRNFINAFNNGENNFKANINRAANNFEKLLDIMGVFSSSLLNGSLQRTQFSSEITNMLNPTTTSAEIISYFIKIYQRYINLVNKIIKNNSNKTYKINHWFTNNYVDTRTSINIGYKFIDFPRYSGLGLINTAEYASLIDNEINRYLNSFYPYEEKYEQYKYCYLGPSLIKSFTKNLDLSQLAVRANFFSNKEYIDLEIDIKNNEIVNKAANVFNTFSDSNKEKEADLRIKANLLIAPASLKINNSLLFDDDLKPIKQSGNAVLNEDVNETNLILGLMKQFDFSKKKYKNSVKADTVYPKYDSIEDKDLPIHVDLLLNDKCSLIRTSENYRVSLDVNSKFNLLFNTLHKIEVLEYDNNNFNENWILLTKQKIQSLKNGLHLFKLTNYKNKTAGINGMREIELPIYDQYFLFEKTDLELRNFIPPETETQLPPQIIPQIPSLRDDLIQKIEDRFFGPPPPLVENFYYERAVKEAVIEVIKEESEKIKELGISITRNREDLFKFGEGEISTLDPRLREEKTTTKIDTLDLSTVDPTKVGNKISLVINTSGQNDFGTGETAISVGGTAPTLKTTELITEKPTTSTLEPQRKSFSFPPLGSK